MEITNLLHFGTRPELRQWLNENHSKEKYCWVVTHFFLLMEYFNQ